MDTLPYEIKIMIIKYLPCYKFITKDTTSILPIFNEYIMDYINKNLLTDNYCNGYLYCNKLYRDIIEKKMFNIISSIVNKFMEYSNGIIYLDFNNPTPIHTININIIFKFTTVGKYFAGSTDDVVFKLSNSNIGYPDICSVTFFGTSTFINYNENDIQNKLYSVLIRNMDISDTILDIKKMEIIETIYPNGFSNYNDFNDKVLIKYV
jgi:hypothetical protein